MKSRESSNSVLDHLSPHPSTMDRPLEDKPVLAVEQADLGYGRRTVLKDVNVHIHQGGFWCLLGPNGEGKSTFIKALLGAIQPLRGRILLRSDFANRTRLGFVPQECDLNATVPTTVKEFISCGFFGLKLQGHVKSNRLKKVLEILGLSRLRDQSFWTLSGGQRQRCLIARALVRDPLLLIVDEPTAGLDLAAAAGLLQIMSDLSQTKGITVVFVTHDLNIAAKRATHVAMFCKGLVHSGPISETFTSGNLTRTFGVPVEVRASSGGERSVVADPPSIRI